MRMAYNACTGQHRLARRTAVNCSRSISILLGPLVQDAPDEWRYKRRTLRAGQLTGLSLTCAVQGPWGCS